MVDGEGEGRARIVLQVVRNEVSEHWIVGHEGWVSVDVLQPWQVEELADLIANGEEKKSSAVLAQTAHDFGGCRCGGP